MWTALADNCEISLIQREDEIRGLSMFPVKLFFRAIPVLAGFAMYCWANGSMAGDKMKFDAVPPQQPAAIFGTAWTIYADGYIDADAAQRLVAVVAENNIPFRSELVINSHGGSLLGGMELGRAIRQLDFNTYVGRKPEPEQFEAPGECYSACALAFLGGHFRYVRSTSSYGVHRFFAQTTGPSDRDDAQIISASIMNYIRDMGVDPSLFAEMSRAGQSEMNVLEEEQLTRLRVANNGVGETVWSIESVSSPEMIYLKGERDTVYGINKFMIICLPGGKEVLYIIFDPQGRAEEVKKMGAQSLVIDGESIPISKYLIERPTEHNGWINASFELPPSLLNKLRGARTVGVIFRFTFEAPIFLGFDSMDFAEGEKKLGGFLAACR